MGLLQLGPVGGQTTLVSEVSSALLNRTDLSTDRIVSALNFAQDEISRLHDFKEMKGLSFINTTFTAFPNVDVVMTLPTTVKHIHTAVLKFGTLSRKLKMKPWRQFDRMFPAPEALARAIPYFYTRWNQSIYLQPVPDRVYQIQFRATFYPFKFIVTTPTATSGFESKDDLLIKLAAAYLWRSYGRPDKGLEYEMEVFGPDPGRIGGMFAAAVKQDTDMPDMDISSDMDVASLGEYWANPFVRSSP